ncbi:hypothetical protein BASA81_005828 [Batrachochytrium salamandrivorans]|nr:hypothetical protein BASA81_005828 [Batrachochytrium salamandrivorans]
MIYWGLCFVVLLSTLAPAKRLAGSDSHLLYLQRNGQVYGQGYNGNGQLGINSTAYARVPSKMLKVVHATDVCAEQFHSCVVDQGGQVKCAGRDAYGLLGIGAPPDEYEDYSSDVTMLAPVVGLKSGVAQVYCGSSSSCARMRSGAVSCWGWYAGQVRYIPLKIAMFRRVGKGVMDIGVGDRHVCFVAVGGKLYCVGENFRGQLGIGSSLSEVKMPTPVLGLAANNIVSVKCGLQHTCAANSAGAMFCWGSNEYGQLGNSNITEDFYVPVPVLGVTSRVASVWAGHYNSYAIYRDGSVRAFGQDNYGVFGTGGVPGVQPLAIVFGQNVTGVKELRGGFGSVCVLMGDDTVQCTGFVHGGEYESSLTLSTMVGFPVTRSPTLKPTKRPTTAPTLKPTKRPTTAPTSKPTKRITSKPTKRITSKPTQ